MCNVEPITYEVYGTVTKNFKIIRLDHEHILVVFNFV